MKIHLNGSLDPDAEIWKIFNTLPYEDFDLFIIPYELTKKKTKPIE